jgi:hypothetical protein
MLMLTVRRLLLGLAIVCSGELARAQDPQRYVLTSASLNRQLPEFELTGQKVTPAKPGWSVRLKTLAGGRQEGSQLLVVDNGRIRVTLDWRTTGIRAPTSSLIMWAKKRPWS